MSVKSLFKNKTPLVLAPMAGFTDSAFRSIAVDFGCNLTVTEMVSSMALTKNNSSTTELLTRQPNDTNCAVQIFGHDACVMAESVQLLNDKNFSLIDINMGCPVKKIVSNGDGSALLKNPVLASKIVRAVKDSAKSFVSVKFRLGIEDGKNVQNFAKMLADSGADLLTIHLRTAKQMYSGKADFSFLPKIVQAVDIPVIANGDIDSIEKLKMALDMGAFGVAVGRGALGKPQIFSILQSKEFEFDLVDVIEKHMHLMTLEKPMRVCVNEMKKHLAYYLKGMVNAKPTIVQIQNATTLTQQLDLVKQLLKANT